MKNTNYTEHHTAWTRGYISRTAEPIQKPYSGKYGTGYTIETPSYQSTRYHLITYYIEQPA